MSRRRLCHIYVGGAYLCLTSFAYWMFESAGLDAAAIYVSGVAGAGGLSYLLGWAAGERAKMTPGGDPLRDGMRVTPPLEQRHIDALLAFGENCFGPMELDDDHDEALELLRQHRPITQREDPR